MSKARCIKGLAPSNAVLMAAAFCPKADNAKPFMPPLSLILLAMRLLLRFFLVLHRVQSLFRLSRVLLRLLCR